jgi:glycerol-3-phosphate acyltransferase PlsY
MAWKVLALLASYLLGAVPFGYIVVKLARGTDVRGGGSGSTGATNVTRLAGLRAGVVTYVFDVAKGAAAVLLMRQVTEEPVWLGAAAVGAILGHMFPVFLKFRGGKGVATGVGAYVVLAPFAVLSTLLVWVVLFWRSRMVSLASIVATALVPVWVLLWGWLAPAGDDPKVTAVMVGVGCLLVIGKHHQNIRRLLAGTESRFERRGAGAQAGEAGSR